MNQLVRNIILILLVLSTFMLPTLLEAGMIDLPEEDDLTDKDVDGEDFAVISNFPIAWIRIPVHQMSILLRLGISIFALFVVYLGGRSKHRRFNDRTIDAVNVLMAAFLKTALVRAVFNFLFFNPHPLHTYVSMIHIFYPTPIPIIRRVKL